MHRSILVIGATGMLAGATAHLAAECEQLTFTAHTQASLERLKTELHGARANCIGLTLDWNDETVLLETLVRHFEEHGYPDLSVIWLHKDKIGPKIANLIAAGCESAAFFQVRGSAAAKPDAKPLIKAEDFTAEARPHYHQIILGFVVEGESARWLTNKEISDGVIAAIESQAQKSVIGVVEPWSMRPGAAAQTS